MNKPLTLLLIEPVSLLAMVVTACQSKDFPCKQARGVCLHVAYSCCCTAVEQRLTRHCEAVILQLKK